MILKFQRVPCLMSSLVLIIASCSFTSCKRSENGSAQNSSALPQSKPSPEMSFEPDPAKRPVFLSKPAPTRREWVLQVLKQGYHDTGKTNADWDVKVQAAFDAFAQYSRVSTSNWSTLQSTLAAVAETKCDDPMIQYMRARYDTTPKTEAQAAVEFMKAHESMLRGQYHPLFKFYAGLRAVQTARAADDTSNRSYHIARANASLEDLARDTNAPADEVFEPARLWLRHGGDPKWIEIVTANLEPILKSNWGNTEQWLRFEGDLEVNRAWLPGGGEWARSATNKNWEGFSDHLNKAEQLLEKAWTMNSTNTQTPYLMMRVELGQAKGLDRMQQWLDRAMALDSNFYDAPKLMSFYLEPRWYGSETKCLEFGRACVASDKWGGHIPLVLAELHRSLAAYSHLSNSPAYWHRPEVWNDVKSSYEKFFAVNKDTAGYRHSYALDAYDCGQYRVFLDQAKLFADGTNYEFFGGKENFEKMLRTASEAK